MGFLDQWAAEAQRKSDERAARWQRRQRERARAGQLTLLDRWMARSQRKGDERSARWVEHQHQKALAGRMSLMDRWAAHAQRKGDSAAARWLEIDPLYRLLQSGPAKGPSGSTAVIYVEATGEILRRRRITKQGRVVGVGGGYGGVVGLVYVLISLAIWLGFRRSYTIHIHTNGHLGNVHVRLPNELAAYRAAAELVPCFEAEGPDAVGPWRATFTGSTRA